MMEVTSLPQVSERSDYMTWAELLVQSLLYLISPKMSTLLAIMQQGLGCMQEGKIKWPRLSIGGLIMGRLASVVHLRCVSLRLFIVI